MYKIPKFKNKKLEIAVNRPYVPLLADYFLQSYQDPRNFQKFYLVNFFARTITIHDGFYYGGEARDFSEAMFARESAVFGVSALPGQKRIPGNTMAAFKRIYVFGEQLLKFSKETQKTDFTKYSEKQLLKVFKKFSKDYVIFATSLMGFNIQHIIERKVREIFIDDSLQDEKVSILTFPIKQNISILEIIDLLRLRIKLEKAGADVWQKVDKSQMRLLRQHVEKYGWINARGAMGQPWTEQNIFDRAWSEENCAQRLVEMEKSNFIHQKQSVNLLKEIRADKNTKYLVALAKELVYFRTYRTDYLNWIFFNVRPLLIAIAEKRGISYEDIIHYLEKEILSGKKVSDKEVARRRKGYALMLIRPKQLWFSSDPKKIAFWQKEYVETVDKNASEVKGASAYKGKIVGTACVVRNKSEMEKFKTGDILVAPMTTPNMIQIMQKAAAFVTDEGGITCHAAIVARELKKPCVIGTKIATQVFKDGDRVEVDADKGVVKIIK